MIALPGSPLLTKSNRWVRLVILGWIAVPTVLGIQILIGSPSGQSSKTSEPGDEPGLVGQSVPPSGLRTQSCSTSNCHGSLTPDHQADAIRADEYFVWLNDPHARAHRTLFGEKSRTIFQRLGVADEQLRPLEGQADRFHAQWTNCLACHETNSHLSLSVGGADHPVTPAAEGVSCESCHGHAQDWLHRHYRPEWKALGEEGKRKFGFISGENVAAQTQRCVSCHVGSKGSDVNHDLIAAGHPALRFESVWYQSRLPQHWKPGRRAATERVAGQANRQADNATAHPTRDWLIGQLVTASASLEQLERRAAAPASQMRWPEFAEYNCFACHHELKGSSWRRERGFPGLVALGTRKSRLAVPWGNWNLELIPILADQFGSQESQDCSAAFDRLRDSIEEGPVGVIHQSRVARASLEAWLPAVSKISESDATRMLQQIGRGDPEKLISSWDVTATLVLGYAAPHHASPTIPDPLRIAMNRVRLPDDPVAFDSPRDFRSAENRPSLTAEQWVELLKQLAELVPEH